MLRHLFCLLFAAILWTSTVCAAGSDEALQSAQAWLALTDKGEVHQAWEQTSTLFKSNVPADEWEKAFAKARSPMGEVGNRKLLSSKTTTSLPGVPDGEYVVLQFQTEFANKKEAIETITQQKDKDGVWRTAGYLIK